MDQRVSLITLGVADLDHATAYYGALGWQKADESRPGIAFCQLPGQLLGLFPLDDLAKDEGRAGAELDFGAMALAQNLESPEAVDRLCTAALAAGAAGLKAPERVFWGGCSSYGADPDGHVWEFAHNPFFALSRDGTLTLPSAAPP